MFIHVLETFIHVFDSRA